MGVRRCIMHMYKQQGGVIENELIFQKMHCHYNWNDNLQKFAERIEKNLITCEDHIKNTPDPTVLNFLGYLYELKNQYVKAEAMFQKSLEMVNDEPVTLANLAHFYNRRKRYEESSAFLTRLRKVEVNKKEAWQAWSKAYFYVRMFEYDKAVEQYDKAIQYIEHLPQTYRYKIYLYRGIGLNRMAKNPRNKHYFQIAIISLNKALELNQHDHLIFCHLAIAHGNLPQKRKENFRKASEYFHKALCIKPDDSTTMRFFGKLLVTRKHIDEAFFFFNTSIKTNETSASYHNRGILFSLLKKVEDSEKDLKNAVELDQSNFPAIFDLIEIYQIKENYQEALKWCQQMEQTCKSSLRLKYQIADLLLKRGNTKSAIEKFNELLAYAQVKSDNKNIIKAKDILVKFYLAQWMQSKDLNALLCCIDIYIRFNHNKEAIELINQGLQYNPDNFWINYYVGILTIENNYEKGAIALFKAFNLAQNRHHRILCFQKIQDLFLILADQLEQQESISSINAINDQLNKFKSEIGNLWTIYEQLEIEMHKNDRVIWHSNFNLFYNSKKLEKSLSFNGDDIHNILRSEINDKYESLPSRPTNLNFANARLSFFVSDRTHHKSGSHNRKIVTAPLLVKELHENTKHVTNYYSFFQFFINRNENVPRSHHLLQDVLASKPIEKYDDIIRKFNETNPGRGFHREYHCSERALYGFLSQSATIKEIVDSIESQCNNQQGLKIYAMIIDIHSDRYLCRNCEESVYYQYSPNGKLVRKLIAEIEGRGHKVLTKIKTLNIIVRVSAEQPAYGQLVKSLTSHDSKVINVKSYDQNSVLFLQRDDRELESTQSKGLVFTNRKNI